MADDRAWADAPNDLAWQMRGAWAQGRRHRFGSLCQTPSCGRMPNGGHRHCCSLCKAHRGHKHTARCECQEAFPSPVDLRSRSRSPTLPVAPLTPRLEASLRASVARSIASTDAGTSSIASIASIASTDADAIALIARSNAQGQGVRPFNRPPVQTPRAKAIARQWFDWPELLHGDGAEWSIEPDAPPTPTSRAVDVPSVELLHGDGAESAPTPSASSDERTVCAICHERMRWSGGQTVVLNCGHVYCMHCWQSFLENMRMAVQCPQCKTSVGVVIPIYG